MREHLGNQTPVMKYGFVAYLRKKFVGLRASLRPPIEFSNSATAVLSIGLSFAPSTSPAPSRFAIPKYQNNFLISAFYFFSRQFRKFKFTFENIFSQDSKLHALLRKVP
jgi:hypothetical protein